MKYVALLRGINVGGNNTVDMKQLKTCFETAGFKNVSTYINSGNVLFETSEKSKKTIVACIETGIETTFGFPVRVIIRTNKNIANVLNSVPRTWKNDVEQKTDVLFLRDGYARSHSLSLIQHNQQVDTLKDVDGAIVWRVMKKDYTLSGMNKLIGTEIYKNMTARNINTVRKLSALMQN